MQFLKANTAIDVLIGPFVDTADGYTAITTGTIDVELSKNGQALANKNDVTAPTHDAAGTIDGYFNCELDATDTNAEGCLVLVAYVSTALPVRHEYMVLSEAAYDSMFAVKDTGFMDVNIKAVSDDTNAADNLELACDNYSATRGLTGTAVPAVAADGAGGLIISDAGGLDADAMAASVTAIEVDTGTTLDTKLNNIQGGTFDTATDSLEALRNRGDAAWTGSATTSDSGTAQAGSTTTMTLRNGAPADVTNQLNGQIIYISSGTGAYQSRAIKSYDISVPTACVATVISNWATAPDATSVYEIYPDEITEITAAPTAAAVADAVWDENTVGHTSAGTFGAQAATDIDGILSKVTTVETQIGTAGDGLTAINLPNQTMDITGDITGNLSGSVGSVTGAVGSVTGAVGSVTGAVGSVTGNIGGSVASVAGAVGSVTGNVGGNVTGSVGSVVGHTAQTGDTFALANGATGFAAIDTVVDAVKAKTDLMNFGVANQLDCNVESINATTVVGVGTSGNKWRA